MLIQWLQVRDWLYSNPRSVAKKYSPAQTSRFIFSLKVQDKKKKIKKEKEELAAARKAKLGLDENDDDEGAANILDAAHDEDLLFWAKNFQPLLHADTIFCELKHATIAFFVTTIYLILIAIYIICLSLKFTCRCGSETNNQPFFIYFLLRKVEVIMISF